MAVELPSEVVGRVDVAAGDGYEQRIKTAKYRSPSGVEIEFDWEAVSRSTELRGTAYAFRGVNENYVQRTGFGSRKYPIKAIFWGNQHDLAATQFEAAVLESGRGTLTHPLYGSNLRVVSFGSVERSNDMVNDAAASIVSVTFWTSLPSAYPGRAADRKNEIDQLLEGFDIAAAQAFAGAVNVSDEASKQNLIRSARDSLTLISDSLSSIASQTSSANATFDDNVSSVSRGIDVLVGQPLRLADSLIRSVRAPAGASSSISSQLKGYADLADRVFTSEGGNDTLDASFQSSTLVGIGASIRDRAVGNIRTADLVAASAVSGAVRAAADHAYTSRPEAIAAALSLQTMLDDWSAWREAALEGVGEVDAGAAFQKLQMSVSFLTEFLVEFSANLDVQKTITLTRDRTIVDLASELYGDVDASLDRLIFDNRLSGSEILELKAGRKITYYASL